MNRGVTMVINVKIFISKVRVTEQGQIPQLSFQFPEKRISIFSGNPATNCRSSLPYKINFSWKILFSMPAYVIRGSFLYYSSKYLFQAVNSQLMLDLRNKVPCKGIYCQNLTLSEARWGVVIDAAHECFTRDLKILFQISG